MLNKEAGKALAGMLAANTVLTELDVSDNGYDSDEDDGPGFAKELAVGVSANGALTSLNISNNVIGKLVWNGWRAAVGGEVFNFYHSDGRRQDNAPGEPLVQGSPEGVIALADAIKNNGALTSLNILNNNLLADGGKALAEALKGNNVMQELNISNNYLGYDSNYDSDMSGVIAISDAIPTMGAMVTVNVMGNNIGKDQLSKLQEMMKAHPTLVSLCGIANDATDANLSGIHMDADDAVVLADELPAKGALVKLDVSSNGLSKDQVRRFKGLCGKRINLTL
jgi:hypothetical protein